MSSARIVISLTALTLSCAALAACATSIPSPSGNFCDVAHNRLPIIAKRTDHANTLRQIDIINSVHEVNCGTLGMAKR